MVKLQEVPDTIPEGETPQSVLLFAYDDLVDYPKPGDRVIVTGYFFLMNLIFFFVCAIQNKKKRFGRDYFMIVSNNKTKKTQYHFFKKIFLNLKILNN